MNANWFWSWLVLVLIVVKLKISRAKRMVERWCCGVIWSIHHNLTFQQFPAKFDLFIQNPIHQFGGKSAMIQVATWQIDPWCLTFGKLTSDDFIKDLRYTTKLENLIKLLVFDLNYVKRSKDERLNMYGHRNICWDSKSDLFFQNLRPNKFSRANSGSGENAVGKLAIPREQIQMDRNAAPSAKQGKTNSISAASAFLIHLHLF